MSSNGKETVLFNAAFPLTAQGFCEITGSASLGPDGDDAGVELRIDGRVVDSVSVSDERKYRLEWQGPLRRGEHLVELVSRSCFYSADPTPGPTVAVKAFQRVPFKRP